MRIWIGWDICKLRLPKGLGFVRLTVVSAEHAAGSPRRRIGTYHRRWRMMALVVPSSTKVPRIWVHRKAGRGECCIVSGSGTVLWVKVR
jgi:hypothetical protein